MVVSNRLFLESNMVNWTLSHELIRAKVRRIQSRVRFAIDDGFQENDLVIALPQRDVRLDTVAPLEVRFVDGNGGAAPGETTNDEPKAGG